MNITFFRITWCFLKCARDFDYYGQDGFVSYPHDWSKDMKYSELLDEINAMPAERRRIMKRLAQAVGAGGDINARYECMLDTATSCDEFFGFLYNHKAARSDYAWAMVARALYPDWFEQFDYEQVEKGVPLENGCIVLHSSTDKSAIPIPIPGNYEAADVYLFADGEINESALMPAGVYLGSYYIGDIEISGQFSVGIDGNRVVVIRWIYGADGFRISEKSKLKIS